MFSEALTQAVVKMLTDSERELQARQREHAQPVVMKQPAQPSVLARLLSRRFLKAHRL